MNKLDKTCAWLGDPYRLETLDGVPAIYRDLGNGFDIEVFSTDGEKTWLIEG